MITAVATVQKVVPMVGRDQCQVVLSCQQQTSCSGCASKSSCATGQVSKMLGNKQHTWSLISEHMLQVGEKVEIGFPEKQLISKAAIIYLLPLLGLLLGALLGEWLFRLLIPSVVLLTEELGAIIGGGLGFLLAFILVRARLHSKLVASAESVTIIRRLGEVIASDN